MPLVRAALLSICVLPGACHVSRLGPDAAWRVEATGVSASLRGVAPVDRLVCYVGGADGALLKTVDGGRSWVGVAPPGSDGCDFRDLQAFGAGCVVAMVAGTPARIYRTEDGGSTWRCVHEDPRAGAFLDAMAFDGPRGVAFGDPLDGRFVLLATTDRGRTWRDVPGGVLPAPEAGEAAFAASGGCVSVGAGAFSLVTGAGACRHVRFAPGTEPASASLPLQRGADSRGGFSVAWRGLRGVCVGGDYRAPLRARGTAAVTRDGGRTWEASNAGGYRSCAVWLGDLDVISVGSHGASWSVDGGISWSAFGSEAFHSVAVASDGSVWACGAGGRVGVLVLRNAR